MADLPNSSARILVVDDDPAILDQVEAIGHRHLFEVIRASGIEEALKKSRAQPPDAALIDIYLGPDELGVNLPRQLRALPGCARLPLGFISSDGSLEARIAAARSGASVYLVKPVDPEELASAVHQLVALGKAPAPQLLLMSGDKSLGDRVESRLKAAGMDVVRLLESALILDALSQYRPDLLILDELPPTLHGMDMCRMLRATAHWRDIPIVLLAQSSHSAHCSKALEAGADVCLPCEQLDDTFLATIRTRVERSRRIHERSDRDVLTGLFLRRMFMDLAGGRFDDAVRHKSQFTLCLLDVDHFKKINDTHGHHVGDRVLSGLGHLLTIRFRPDDIRGRWGGEEFCIAFPGSTLENASGVMTRLLEEFKSLAFSDDEHRMFSASFSAGLAAFPGEASTLKDLIVIADRRLYLAKQAGRSRVVST